MPGLQPGVIGLEDLKIIFDILASSFNPAVEAKIFRSATLSTTLGTGATAGQVASIEIATPGFGYSTPPVITITGEGGSSATATCTIDSLGQVETVTVTAAGSGYTSANAVAGANPNLGKIASLTIVGAANRKFTVAPTIVIEEPGSQDADGNPLASNVTALATFNLQATDDLSDIDNPIYKGEITGINITNAGVGYVEDPKVTIKSDVNNEIRATGLQPILILLLNHTTAVDLQNNDFFNRKSTYNAQSFFRNNHEIQFFGDKVISSDNESLINKYNIKSNILT